MPSADDASRELEAETRRDHQPGPATGNERSALRNDPDACSVHLCPLNRAGRCGTADGIAITDAPAIFHSPALDADGACHARTALLKAYEAPLRKCGKHLGAHAATSELYLWLADLARKNNLPPRITLGYLVRGARNQAIDRMVHRDGKRRCGACVHFSHGIRRCLLHGLRYGPTLDPGSDPRRLGPPCSDYSNRRGTASLGERTPAGLDASPDDVERLGTALDALAHKDAEAASLIHDAFLNGLGRDGARRKRKLTRTRFADALARNIHSLEEILDDMP